MIGNYFPGSISPETIQTTACENEKFHRTLVVAEDEPIITDCHYSMKNLQGENPWDTFVRKRTEY